MPRTRPEINRWTLLGAAAVVLALIGVGVAVAVNAARTEPSYTSSYAASGPENYDYQLRVSMLGDSYTKGTGAFAETGYAKKIGSALCWDANINGVAGTGYANGGVDQGGQYVNRLKYITRTNPELILVQGSLSDAGQADIQGAVARTLEQLRADAPDATIITVGPVDTPVANNQRAAAVRDAVRDASAKAGVHFIDPIALQWLPDPRMYSLDGLELNDLGHDAYADLLRSELEKQGLQRLNTCAR